MKPILFISRIFAYSIPFVMLLYVMYINFLPFGYSKLYTITVGSKEDTKKTEFYLEPARSLSDTKVLDTTTTYRTLQGIAYVIFNPKENLNNVSALVSIDGAENILTIPPFFEHNLNDIGWDFLWDFEKEIPQDLKGSAFLLDAEVVFNGQDTRLELPDSKHMFENTPFSVYAEWTPKNSENNMQQIVGHFNWEILQNKNNVEFRVGRMNNATGTTYSVQFPVGKDFFNKKHSLLAVYNPGPRGFISLYVDTLLVGMTNIYEDTIWNMYGNSNISFGKSDHGNATYFMGSLGRVAFISKNIMTPQKNVRFTVKGNKSVRIPIVATDEAVLKKINLHVFK